MDMLLLGLVAGVALTGFLVGTVALTRAGGLGRAWWGLTVAGRTAQDPDLAVAVGRALGGGPAEPDKPSAEPLRLLAVLQSESRLVDFLLEDLGGASDEQVGQAVRDIHRKAGAALRQHLTLGPVLGGAEGERVEVPAGFDPAAVRVTGAVSGSPPFSGELQHAGWRVTDMRLPAVPAGADGFVVQPAEVVV